MIIQPLFILSPPRSFTSVTCAMIGNHPQMFGVAETNLFARNTIGELEELYRFRPRYQHGLLRTVAELSLSGQSEDSIETAEVWLREHHAVSTAQVFGDLMAWASPRGLVDKSPIYVVAEGALERIGSAFPGARFLHLTRHPRGTCESIFKLRQSTVQGQRRLRRLWGRGTRQSTMVGQVDPELTPDQMWLKPHNRISSFLATVAPAQKMCLQGELLLSDPRKYLTKTASWLAISIEELAIEAMLHPETSPFARFGPRNAPFGNDPSFLKEPALRPYKPKPMSLDGPLSWDSTLIFSDELKAVACELGYH